MIANLNLASQPFRNRTLPWTIATVITCVSVVALIITIGQGSQIRAQADAVERDLRALRTEANALRAKASEVKESLPPEQLQTLEAAHLLVARKRFSWSRLLADLESSLPANIRVTRIRVRDVARRSGQTLAELELTVVGKEPDDITGMISEMDRAGTFAADLLTVNPRTAKGESGTEAMLRVRYTPRPGRPAKTSDRHASVASSATPVISSKEAQ